MAFPPSVPIHGAVMSAFVLIAFLRPYQVDSAFPAHDVATQFNTFLRVTGTAYPDKHTYAHRLGIFAKNVAFIEAFNQNSTSGSLKLGVNQFADLTATEFKRMYLPGMRAGRDWGGGKYNLPQWRGGSGVVPDSIDWRAKGAVTPVKDQKNCGSCWAFSATGAIEAAWFLSNGSLISLSEEELVDCSGGGDHGCSGGDPASAFNWIVKNGICSEKSYPYTAYQDECHNQFYPCEVAAHIAGHSYIEPNNEHALKEAVAQQPVSVEIEADSDVFRFYKSGVLKSSGCGTSLDHAVLLVGYGTQDGQDYWLVKNSWNETWGDQGYIKLARTDSSASYGECGIALRPSIPIVHRESILV